MRAYLLMTKILPVSYRDCKILVSMQNTSSLTRRAEKILKGVTLESVAIITRVARALRAGGVNRVEFPLLFHMDAILNGGAEVDLPWDQFGC